MRKLLSFKLLAILLIISSCSSDESTEPISSNPPPEEEQPASNITAMWGMTTGGGDNSLGAIFKTDKDGNNFTIVYSFDGINGKNPFGGLCHASNGKLYGLTQKGGANDRGILFKFDSQTNTFTKIHDFNEQEVGYPSGSLIQATNGKLYGLTSKALFELDIQNDSYQNLHNFNEQEGYEIKGSLIQASNGNLYGMANNGGAYYGGTIFEYNISSGILTNKVSLNGGIGNYPDGDLVEANNGKLYGVTTNGGGIYGGGYFYEGTLFEYDPTSNTYNKKVGFFGALTGPVRSLTLGVDGKLYGIASDVSREIFSYDIDSNNVTRKSSISNQGLSVGNLFQSSNGKFYGLTLRNSPNTTNNNMTGTLYEFDPISNSMTIKYQYGTPTCNLCDDNGITGNLIGI